MKMLYAIQGTGNGHIMRANELLPVFKKYAVVDVLISSTENEVPVNYTVKYKLKGLGFVIGKHGGINYHETFKQSQFLKFLCQVKNLPVEDYDFIVNDFEPVTAWACRLRKVPLIGMSHQAAVINPLAPHAGTGNFLSKKILHHYAPVKDSIGFHFQQYARNILTPVIRQDVRNAGVENSGHISVYLPAYEDEFLVKFFRNLKNTSFHIFSKRAKTKYSAGNCIILPIDAGDFLKSMAASEGVFCGAGFETPAEAIHLGKKLLVVPMKGQYEQQCNAVALGDMGISLISSLNDAQSIGLVRHWICKGKPLEMHYPDIREKAVEKVFSMIV